MYPQIKPPEVVSGSRSLGSSQPGNRSEGTGGGRVNYGPFPDELGIGGRGGRRRPHELGDEVAEHADEDHDDGERDQDPVPNRRVENQLLRHRRCPLGGVGVSCAAAGGVGLRGADGSEASSPGWVGCGCGCGSVGRGGRRRKTIYWTTSLPSSSVDSAASYDSE